jgi:o-succinylbenzoate synthase
MFREVGSLHRVEFRTYSIAMTTRFRGIDRREGMLVRGAGGWAEFSPFLDYAAVDCAAWLKSALDAANNPWPPSVRAFVPVNATIPATGPERAASIALASGCTTAKIKVGEPGQSLDDDLNRVAAVRAAMGASAAIRVDANGAWDVREAVDAIGMLERAAAGLQYVEQPCASVEDLARVRRKVDVPIAADESIRRTEDPLRVRELEAADVAVLKVQPLGGMRECLRIAEQIGLPVVVSSAVETSIGLAMGVAVAAALPELPFACGLGTASLLAGDVVGEPLVPVDGALPVLRPELDEAAFAEVFADTETTLRWKARLDQVQQRLGS